MALSGSQYELFHNSCHKLIVEWSASQNVGGNYSTVTANLYVQGTQGWSTIYSGSVVKSVSLVINGNRKNGTARIDINGTEKRLLLSHTVNVPHNADGSKSFRIEGMWKPQITWSGTYYGSEEWTRQDWSLNAIPRASTFNQSATTFNMDGEGTIYINPASSSFTHKLYMHFGNRRVLLKDNPPTRQNFTVRFSASDFASQIPNATSGVGTLTLETYNGGSLVGSSSRQTYLNLPSNYIPSQPSVTVSDESSVPAKLGVSKTAGIYVKGMSLLRFSCSSNGTVGSSISNYKVQIGNQSFGFSGGTIDIDLSKFDVGTGSLNATVTVTDSRGRTNSRTVGIKIQNYTPPKINNFSVVRQNNSANVIITKPVSVSSILNGSTNINSYTVKTEYKLSSATSWTNWRNETNTSAVINSGGWDVTKSYDIRVTLSDKLNQMVVTASISTAKTLISYHKDVGVGIGKMHERGALDVGGDMYVSGIIRQNNNQVIDTSNYSGYFDSRYNSKFNTDFDNRMNATFNGKFDSAYNNKIAVSYNKNIALGYGLQGRLVKRGNTVTISVYRQIVNWSGSGEFKLLAETIPSDIRPVEEVNLILTKNAGSTNPPPMTIHIQKDGHMYFTNFNPGTWVHCGTVTYQLV
ncbi:DUF859 family phage minor structural protein [Enterococcus cecorum]|uniref:DUF859 family phage minor structural protein n=1 Tax=Enterococcus cecorum TaxID=44008 RepID=UPI000AF23DF0|nr:DUF859 family phage minor structural protein [Enterococcus cecorum]CAI3342588.1 hypothetical protein CIRMBP1308_00363 [Enterococcus cecorum]